MIVVIRDGMKGGRRKGGGTYKEERNEILMTELKKLLQELMVPTEYIKALFQDNLSKASFVRMLIEYRGLQILLEQKFEILVNVNFCKVIKFPTLKKIGMEEYI